MFYLGVAPVYSLASSYINPLLKTKSGISWCIERKVLRLCRTFLMQAMYIIKLLLFNDLIDFHNIAIFINDVYDVNPFRDRGNVDLFIKVS
jgi:hypothetical protein